MYFDKIFTQTCLSMCVPGKQFDVCEVNNIYVDSTANREKSTEIFAILNEVGRQIRFYL